MILLLNQPENVKFLKIYYQTVQLVLFKIIISIFNLCLILNPTKVAWMTFCFFQTSDFIHVYCTYDSRKIHKYRICNHNLIRPTQTSSSKGSRLYVPYTIVSNSLYLIQASRKLFTEIPQLKITKIT